MAEQQVQRVVGRFFHDPFHGHCVEETIKGDATHTTAISKVSEAHVAQFPDAWERYQRGFKTDDISGTPLASVPGLNPNNAGLYALKGVRNAEQLAALSDNAAHDLAPNGIVLRDTARLLVGTGKPSAPDFDPDEMKRQLDRARAEKAQAEADRDEAMRIAEEATKPGDDEEPAKRGPGRPRKDV